MLSPTTMAPCKKPVKPRKMKKLLIPTVKRRTYKSLILRKNFAKSTRFLSLPFKKRHHYRVENTKPTIRVPIVLLRDIFHDKYLCERYDLYKQFLRIVGLPYNADQTHHNNSDTRVCTIYNDLNKNGSFTNCDETMSTDVSGTSNLSQNDEQMGCSSTFSNEEMFQECRKITMDNLLIKVTKFVANEPSQVVSSTRQQNVRNCDKMPNIQRVFTLPNFRRRWKLKHTFTADDKLRITSRDMFFTAAEVSSKSPLVGEINDSDSESSPRTNCSWESQLKDTKLVTRNGESPIFDLRCKLNSEFKVPLPPAKRPPSRMKRSNCSSSSSSTISSSGTIIVPTKTITCKRVEPVEEPCFKNDDAISLYAGSIFSTDSAISPAHKLPILLEPETGYESPTGSVNLSIGGADEIELRNRQVQSWLEAGEAALPDITDTINCGVQTDIESGSSTTQLLLQTDSCEEKSPSRSPCYQSPKQSPKRSPNQKTFRWSSVSQNSESQTQPEPTPKPPEPRNVLEIPPKPVKNSLTIPRNIPRALTGICFFHFVGKCWKTKCNYAHVISPAIQSQILNLDVDSLLPTYKWTLQYRGIFKETFPFFVRRLARLQHTPALIELVNDVLSQELLDRTPYIQVIVQALQNMGFSFKQALEELISAHGCQNLCFTDILLNLIVEAPKQLEENWSLIQRLIKYRTKEIDSGVISDILKHNVTLKSVKLCENVCNDIFQKHVVNFQFIDRKIIEDFLTQLFEFKLFDLYFIMRSKSGVHSETSFLGRNSPYSISNRSYSPLGSVNHVAFPRAAPNAAPSNGQCAYGSTPQLGIFPLGDMSPNTTNILNHVMPTEQLDSVDAELTQEELMKLSNCLRVESMGQFIDLLQKYKSSCKVDSFAANTVVCLSKMDHIDKSYWHMWKRLELAVPNFMEDLPLKKLVEQISFNVIDILTRADEWEAAGLILNKFTKHLDDIVKAREFKKESTRTLAARYLYVSKIFMKNEQFGSALDILVREDLKLLYSPADWKIEKIKNDEMYRNAVVRELIQRSLQSPDLKHARYIIFYLINQKLNVGCDVWDVCSTLMIKLLDNYEHFKQDIIEIFKGDVFMLWFRKLKRQVLRGMCVLLLHDIAVDDMVEFYNRCVHKNVYNAYLGNESEIHISTDTLQEEVFLALRYFFGKLIKHNFPPKNLKIMTTCPEVIYKEPKVLCNQDVSFTELKARIAEVLLKSFQVYIEPQCVKNSDPYICISAEMVTKTVNNLTQKDR